MGIKFTRIIEFWLRFKKNRPAVIGFAILIFFLFIAVFAPIITPYNPTKISNEIFVSPSGKRFFGTDHLGRDIFSGVIFGARVSLFIGLFAAGMSATIGITVGSIAGYFGGVFDDILMRMTEAVLIIPRFFLILVIVAINGPSILTIAITLGILGWPGTARLVRAEFLSLKQREYVEAARALGASDYYLIFYEILPNAIPPVIINTTLSIADAIKSEAALSFIGLGDPRVISWGLMLNNAQHFLRHAWWITAFPGLCLFLTTLAFNLVGDGLNDALNPRLKEKT